jgi:hypothetical protein
MSAWFRYILVYLIWAIQLENSRWLVGISQKNELFRGANDDTLFLMYFLSPMARADNYHGKSIIYDSKPITCYSSRHSRLKKAGGQNENKLMRYIIVRLLEEVSITSVQCDYQEKTRYIAACTIELPDESRLPGWQEILYSVSAMDRGDAEELKEKDDLFKNNV